MGCVTWLFFYFTTVFMLCIILILQDVYDIVQRNQIMSTTPAIRFLKQKKVEFTLREYEMKIKGAEYAAKVLNWPIEKMVKTLVVALSDKNYVLCLMPGNLELSLKKLARVCKVKTAMMTSTEDAQKLTGYLVGGISPFGTKKKMKVLIEESIMNHEIIGINAGKRGSILFISPEKAAELLDAETTDLAC